MWRETRPPRSPVVCQAPSDMVLCGLWQGGSCILNWGLIAQAGEECSARVPSLAWQVGSCGKRALSCQLEMVFSAVSSWITAWYTQLLCKRNLPPFLLPPSSFWQVKWEWSALLDAVPSYKYMRLSPHPTKLKLSPLGPLQSQMRNPGDWLGQSNCFLETWASPTWTGILTLWVHPKQCALSRGSIWAWAGFEHEYLSGER